LTESAFCKLTCTCKAGLLCHDSRSPHHVHPIKTGHFFNRLSASVR